MGKGKFVHPKDQIVAFMQRIYDYGMTTTSGGNLSIMDADGCMWISPSGIDKGTLRREDIMCITPDGKIHGPHRPSCEYPFHSGVYKMRPDVKAILHAHPPMLVSFSVTGQIPNTFVHPTARRFCGDVGFAGYDVPGSEALGEKVSAAFAAGHRTILLENHGSCVAGTSMLHAFQRFETLDYCARMIYNAMCIGKPHYLTEAEIALSEVDRNAEFKPVEFGERSSDEMEVRYQMAKLVRRAYKQKMFTSTSGTLAMRLDKTRFLITPHDADRASLEADDLVLVDGRTYEAGRVPSQAMWLFREILDAQPEVNSLLIATPPNLMGYYISHEKFDPCVIPESYIMLREMPSFPYGTQFNNLKEITSTLSLRYPIITIENDCAISCGKTLLEPFDRLEVAEYSAQATICAPRLGCFNPINGEQIVDLVKAFKLIP